MGWKGEAGCWQDRRHAAPFHGTHYICTRAETNLCVARVPGWAKPRRAQKTVRGSPTGIKKLNVACVEVSHSTVVECTVHLHLHLQCRWAPSWRHESTCRNGEEAVELRKNKLILIFFTTYYIVSLTKYSVSPESETNLLFSQNKAKKKQNGFCFASFRFEEKKGHPYSVDCGVVVWGGGGVIYKLYTQIQSILSSLRTEPFAVMFWALGMPGLGIRSFAHQSFSKNCSF